MNLQELLQLGESYHQEFKETIDKSLVREICASSFFYKTAQENNVTDNVTDKQPRLVQILNTISSNPRITTTELTQNFAVSKRTILRDIDKLKQNYIRRVGNEHDGIWIVIKQEQNK